MNHPLQYLRNIKWRCVDRVFVALRHVISKYIFRRLDKQWYNSIYLIAYNILSILSIIAWHFIRKHDLIYINRKYTSYWSLLIKFFRCSLYLTKFKHLYYTFFELMIRFLSGHSQKQLSDTLSKYFLDSFLFVFCHAPVLQSSGSRAMGINSYFVFDFWALRFLYASYYSKSSASLQ